MRVEIEPGVGAGPVRLGMIEAEVRAAMGDPDLRDRDWLDVGERWFWHENTFQVCFGRARTVGSIQLCHGGVHTETVDYAAEIATAVRTRYPESDR